MSILPPSRFLTSDEPYPGRARGNRTAMLLGGVLLALATWRWRPFLVAVEGRSMSPALEPGDFLVAVRPNRLRRGSLVVVEHPERPGFELVKRVVRLPGDEDPERDGFWVEGDDPGGSTDSRSFGPVGRSAIRGVVVLRLWPPSRAGLFRTC